jgi:hypothetical protein
MKTKKTKKTKKEEILIVSLYPKEATLGVEETKRKQTKKE